jgi:hypothetical protein
MANNMIGSPSVSIYTILQNNDLLLYILDFLSCRDIFTLLLKTISNKIYKPIRPKKILKLQVNKHLNIFTKKFGLSANTLMECLGRIWGIIAGGFPLAIFTGELYTTSDIDIYIPATCMRQFRLKIKLSGLQKLLINDHKHHGRNRPLLRLPVLVLWPHGSAQGRDFETTGNFIGHV